ncbi:MAG: hypothetical protein ACTIAG_02030 [Lactobacillus sp.]|nr:hypothetical protein [Lactobacillus sp.]MDN6055287.1 hypothetical protein [Lactococcus lactis]
MKKARLTLQILGTLLGFYLIAIYAINADAEVFDAKEFGGNFKWLVPTLWLCVALFILEVILLWSINKANRGLVFAITILTVLMTLLAYFLGLSVWLPFINSTIFSLILVITKVRLS